MRIPSLRSRNPGGVHNATSVLCTGLCSTVLFVKSVSEPINGSDTVFPHLFRSFIICSYNAGKFLTLKVLKGSAAAC